MKGKTTNNLFHCFTVLKGVITFCILLSMMAKPVASIIFDSTGIEYELYESYEEVDLEEKEGTTEFEEEDTKPNYYNIFDSEFHSNYKSSLFALQKDLMSSHLDIPCPPPDGS